MPHICCAACSPPRRDSQTLRCRPTRQQLVAPCAPVPLGAHRGSRVAPQSHGRRGGTRAAAAAAAGAARLSGGPHQPARVPDEEQAEARRLCRPGAPFDGPWPVGSVHSTSMHVIEVRKQQVEDATQPYTLALSSVQEGINSAWCHLSHGSSLDAQHHSWSHRIGYGVHSALKLRDLRPDWLSWVCRLQRMRQLWRMARLPPTTRRRRG